MTQPNHEASFRAIQEEAKKRQQASKDTALPKIHIGMATCGIASGALETKRAFEEVLAEQNTPALIHTVGCLGHCYAEPVVIVENAGFPIFYYNVTPGKAGMIVKSFLGDGDPLFEHLLGATEENDLIPQVKEFSRDLAMRKGWSRKCPASLTRRTSMTTSLKADTKPWRHLLRGNRKRARAGDPWDSGPQRKRRGRFSHWNEVEDYNKLFPGKRS